MRPIGIGDIICRSIAKLVRRSAGDQEKMTCGSIQLCAGLEDGIEEATVTMAQQ